MAASSLISLTPVICNQPVFRTLSAAAATDGLHPGDLPIFNRFPRWNCTKTPRHKTTQDVPQYLKYPAVVRTPGTALRPEHIFTQPIEMSPGHEDAMTIEELVPLIKENLSRLRNSRGEISVSAYDTAWVARIPDANGSDGPHFPLSLEWIVANQHPDGSWGDSQKDWLYDRFIQTVACIVTLTSWNYSSSSIQKGVEYITRNADRLEDEEILSMPIGFELAFPALLGEAKSLGLNLPYGTPFFGVIEKIREEKLRRVPLKLLHSRPTTMLHTLEGLQSLNIDWGKVLEFQGEDGSMCCSPSATAVLYMHTRNKNSLSFLETTVRTFNHAVPTCYTLDTFHNLWVVDTLERLGISRYFQAEIEALLGRVYSEWSNEEGINWSSMLKGIPDLDDTSMAFRLLRQHGYNVSAEGFKGFQKGKAFACFPVGQMVQGVSDMFNLYRASQAAYPGEDRLADAESFSRVFLVDALKNDKGDADKWSLKKDMSGEVEYAVRHPEFKSLNRIQVRHYLDKYGPDDAWIGKSIYRLRLVNNSEYLKLAKADFNLCQTLHQKEVHQILRWISDSLLPDTSNVREGILTLYSMFSADFWEPEFSTVRIAAGKCMFIAMSMHQLFVQSSSLTAVQQIVEAVRRWDPTRVYALPEKFRSCFMMLYNTLNEAAKESPAPNELISLLVPIWDGLLSSLLLETEWRAQPTVGGTDEALKVESTTSGLKAIVFSAILISGEIRSPHSLTWMEKDSDTLLRIVSEAVGLAQRSASKKSACIIQSDESQVIMIQQEQQQQQEMMKELNLQLGQMSAAPSLVKKVLLSIAKVANCYYGDEYEQSKYFSLTKP